MEEEAEYTLDSFRLSDDEWKSYATVRDKFEAYIVKKSTFLSKKTRGRASYIFCQ